MTDLPILEPVAYLPFDAPQLTVAQMTRHFATQLAEHPAVVRLGMRTAEVQVLARRGALELYVKGWRTTEGIWHHADNPIPAPIPPTLPSPVRLAA
jgi:hypothetical protein